MFPTPKSVSSRVFLIFMAPLLVVSVLVSVLGTKYYSGRSPSDPYLDPVVVQASGHLHTNITIKYFYERHDSPYNASYIKQSNSRVYTKLDNLEMGLQRARKAIRDAIWRGNETRVTDQDYLPPGPIYWNSYAFQRF